MEYNWCFFSFKYDRMYNLLHRHTVLANCVCVFVCIPVQIDKDDTLRVIYQPFQLSGLVTQLFCLYGNSNSSQLLYKQFTDPPSHVDHMQHCASVLFLFSVQSVACLNLKCYIN